MNIEKPKSIEQFLGALNTLRVQKRKAANLLFEEIEHDVIGKEKFVIEQVEKVKHMNQNYMTMLDYEKVLEAVSYLLPKFSADNNQADHGNNEQFRGAINGDDR